MNPERWKRVKTLLDQAIALDPLERRAFLDRECDRDSELKQEVESLLASHEQAGGRFLPSRHDARLRIGEVVLHRDLGLGFFLRLALALGMLARPLL